MNITRLHGLLSYVEQSQPVSRAYINPFIQGEERQLTVEIYEEPTVIGIISPTEFFAKQFEFYGQAPNDGVTVTVIHQSLGWAGLECHRYGFFTERANQRTLSGSGAYFPINKNGLVGHLHGDDVEKLLPAFRQSDSVNPMQVSELLESYLSIVRDSYS